MDFPIFNYPTGAETDPGFLYRSLGSFWTQLFQDKNILKGYTLGLAEEIVQRYLDLIDVINSYSVSDIPVFNKQKWYPIYIYKSKFNESPLLFEKNDAVFGAQSAQDQYYQNVVFQFGFSKIPVAQVYLYDVGSFFKEFQVIADKIINPTNLFINNTDVVLKEGVLYFNTNIFNNSSIPRFNVIGENGEISTYIDKNGNTVVDEVMILWAYNGMLDLGNLYNSFGYIFEISLPNSEFVKTILQNVFSLYVNGPTVQNVLSVCSAFLGVNTILSSVETVEEVFTDSSNKWVITDKNVYQFELYQNVLPTVFPGAVFYAGDGLIDSILYYDTVKSSGTWWKNPTVIGDKLALSQYLFFGNYQNQFILKNSIDLITLDQNGNIVFPIEGTIDDVAAFHENLNGNAKTLAFIKKSLELKNPGDSVPINPVDFVISNFLKNNLALIKFKFNTEEMESAFLSLLPILKKQLPPYTYVIFDLTLQLPLDQYNQLNLSTPFVFASSRHNGVSTQTQQLSADGSNAVGKIENLPPYGYKDATHRLFSISLSIPQQPYEQVVANTHSGGTSINDGKLLIANYVAGDSTAVQNKLLLLDYT